MVKLSQLLIVITCFVIGVIGGVLVTPESTASSGTYTLAMAPECETDACTFHDCSGGLAVCMRHTCCKEGGEWECWWETPACSSDSSCPSGNCG